MRNKKTRKFRAISPQRRAGRRRLYRMLRSSMIRNTCDLDVLKEKVQGADEIQSKMEKFKGMMP